MVFFYHANHLMCRSSPFIPRARPRTCIKSWSGQLGLYKQKHQRLGGDIRDHLSNLHVSQGKRDPEWSAGLTGLNTNQSHVTESGIEFGDSNFLLSFPLSHKQCCSNAADTTPRSDPSMASEWLTGIRLRLYVGHWRSFSFTWHNTKNTSCWWKARSMTTLHQYPIFSQHILG